MKFIISTVATLFLAASAMPVERAPLTATISLSDNQSGAQGNVEIPIDGVTYNVYDLWKDTSVNHGGSIRVTSGALNGGAVNHPICSIRNEGGVELACFYANASGERTYVKFGSNPDQLEFVSLTTATITCSQLSS